MNDGSTSKSLSNTSGDDVKKTTSDIIFFGEPDTFKLISKASSVSQGWMKSTKAMYVEGIGCVVQTTSEFRNVITGRVEVATDSLAWVPGVCIEDIVVGGTLTGRRLVGIHR